MIDSKDYLRDPCGASSIPYWKAKSMIIPSNLLILRHDDYIVADYGDYWDEPYFRLIHDLENIPMALLPDGYSLCECGLDAYASHICSCYGTDTITEEHLLAYQTRSVFDASLWIAVRYDATGQIVASGIAEFDREVGEGALEWIQVSSEHRRRGLGRFVVVELLHRMRNFADFVTVSGQCKNPTSPELLYRHCGFTGDHIWHILRKKDI